MDNYIQGIKNQIIKKIKQKMNEDNITNYRLAKDNQLNEAYTSRVLNGKTNASIDRLLEIAAMIELRIDKLIFKLDKKVIDKEE